MAGVDLALGGSDELVEQVIGFHAETPAATDFDVGTGLVFVTQRVAKSSGATSAKRHHLIRKMRVVVGDLVMAELPQRFDIGILRLRVVVIDYVINFGNAAQL